MPGGQSFRVKSAEVMIGSAVDCAVTIDDPDVAPIHCSIEVQSNSAMLTAFSGDHGVFFKGSRVLIARLKNGDSFQVGSTTLQLTISSRQPPRDPIFPVAWSLGCIGLFFVVAAMLINPILSLFTNQTTTNSDQASLEIHSVIPDSAMPSPHAPLVVNRTSKLAAKKIKAEKGGQLDAGELLITIAPGAFDRDRRLEIHRVEPYACPFTIGFPGSAEKIEPQPAGAWEVDAGADSDLFAGSVEVAVDLTALGADDSTILFPAITLDGATWTRLPYERRGDTLVFQTRHFCVVTVWMVTKAVGLGLALGYLANRGIHWYFGPQEEIPDPLETYKPFASLQPERAGFEVQWSEKLAAAGATAATSTRNNPKILKDLEEIIRQHMAMAKSEDPDPKTWPQEIDHKCERAVLSYLRKSQIPEAVWKIEEALVFAQQYLESRGFNRPFHDLPVYVAPKLGGDAGFLHNPWLGRRYVVISTDISEAKMQTTVLHELFHHYQTGYVWLDRNGHMPFMEASALLMEREAAEHYRQAGREFDLSDGLALAQVITYVYGLNGPDGKSERKVRAFGYGLTWFLEFLRNGWGGGEIDEFHSSLIENWGATKYNANHKALLWAAGGDEADLRISWLDFCQNSVLESLEIRRGLATQYGEKYGASLFDSKPYDRMVVADVKSVPLEEVYGFPPTIIDASIVPVFELKDNMIRPWSLNFYKLENPGRPGAKVMMRVPRSWNTTDGPTVRTFVREKTDQVRARPITEIDLAPPSSDHSVAVISGANDMYVYVADAGKTGAYLSSIDSATAFLLEPPYDLKLSTARGVVTVSWSRPPAADQYSRFFVYLNSEEEHSDSIAVADSSAEFHPAAYDLDQINLVEMSSAVEIGTAPDGEIVYAESTKNQVEGEPVSGSFLLTSSIIRQSIECTPKEGGSSRFPIPDISGVTIEIDNSGSFSHEDDIFDTFAQGHYTITGRLKGGVFEVSGTSKSDGKSGFDRREGYRWEVWSGSCSITKARSKIAYNDNWGYRTLTTTEPILMECVSDEEKNLGPVVWFAGSPKPADYDKPRYYHTICKGTVELSFILNPQ